MIPQSWDMETHERALVLARDLLETGAVRFDAEHPFRHASGLVSPVWFDGRRLLSFPQARRRTIDYAERMIRMEIADGGDQPLDAIAAGEGGGVPFATLIAERLDLPLVFVRKEEPAPRSGKSRVEGVLSSGCRVLLVEQIATDGHRKARFAEPLQARGCRLSDVFVLFQYGIFDVIQQNLGRLGITMHALSTWWDLLEVANEGSYLPETVLGEIEAYLHDPTHWTEAHADAARPQVA